MKNKNDRIPIYRFLWAKIRFYQHIKQFPDEELAKFLQVGVRTLRDYDKDARHITLEKVDNFLYVNNLELKDLILM